MPVLTDDEWTALRDALDHGYSPQWRLMKDARQTVEAVVWRCRNGATWRATPAELGQWALAAHLHIRWSRLGVWQRVFEHLRATCYAALAEVMLDGTGVRAPARAAGAKGGA